MKIEIKTNIKHFTGGKHRLSNPLMIRYILLLSGVFLMIMPMVYMITLSLKPNNMTFSYPLKIIPDMSQLTLENYQYVLFKQNFFQYFLNTLFVASVSTALSVIISSMLGYCISRFRFPGRNLLYGAIIIIMLIPGLAMLVPQFELAVNFKLVDNLWGVIFFIRHGRYRFLLF